MFDNLKTDKSIQASGDVIGGFSILDSNTYDFTIEMAYIDFSKKTNAMSVNLHLKGANGEQLRNQQWVASGDAKGNKNYYIDKKDGKTKHYLPGFTTINDICLLAVGKELAEVDMEDKMLKLYDFDAKKEVPVTKKVLTGLLQANITLGIIKETVDKTAINDQGNYVPTGETRDQNDIDKAFRFSDSLTTTEVLAEVTEGTFLAKWMGKNQFITANRAKGAATPTGATPMNSNAVASGGATPSIFAQNA